MNPTLVGEVSPPELRGTLGSLFNLGIALGVLGVNAISFAGVGWRALALGFGVLPQVIQVKLARTSKLSCPVPRASLTIYQN